MNLLSDIPEKYKGGFKKMAEISPSQIDDIEEGLSSTRLVASIILLANDVAKLKKIDVNVLREIFLSAASLCAFLEKTSVDNLVSDVISISKNKKLVPDDKIDTLKRTLHTLLSSEKIFYAAKSGVLLSEYGKIFLQANILTDIRPIFKLEVTESPEAALIVHNLHIHYRADEEGEHKDIFFALDLADIKNLKEALSRAENKETSLKAFLNKNDIKHLNE